MVEIRCKKCKNEWDYTGQSKYATCPECFANVTLAHEQWDKLRQHKIMEVEELMEKLKGEQ